MTKRVHILQASQGSHLKRSVLLTAMLLVASCNTLNQPAPASPPSPVVPKASEAAAQVSTPPAPASAQAADNGINRTGRVVQLPRQPEKAPGGQPPQNNVVALNFEQEDFRSVIEQLGDALGINMVIDPTIDAKISLRTSANNPLRYQDIWPLLRLLARNAGVSIEQAGSVWRFQRNASNVPAEIVQPATLSQASASEVMQVTPLTYISLKTLEPILTQVLQSTAAGPVQSASAIVHMGVPNLIGIMGTPGQLARVNELLAVIDSDPFQNQGMQLYQLRSSPAAKVAEELTNVLKLIEGGQSSYQVLGLERINSVLVLAPANRGFDEINRWMNILDAESQEQSAQLFVYKVKNLEAKALAESLTTAFTDKNSASQNGAQRTGNQVQQVIGPQGQVGIQVGPGLQQQGQNQNQQVNPIQQLLRNQLLGVANSDAGTAANLNIGITADEKSNTLLIKATPREYRQLLGTINSMDAVPLQVIVNAVIGQVTLTDGNQFGVDWSRVSANATGRVSSQFLPTAAGGSSSTGTTVGAVTNVLLTNPTTLPVQATGFVLSRTFADGATQITAALQALAQDNKVTLLARPTIMASNNQEGKIHVGQSVPVTNGSTLSATGTSTSITYRDVGIELAITPQISHDGYINLKISQKMSSVEQAATAVGNNPAFNSQELTTQAVVADQATIVLGGLIQEDKTDAKNGVPLLEKIPIIGRAFSYNQVSNSRKELFVILHPQIVYGDARDAAIMADIREKFIEVGKLLNKSGL